MVQELKSRGKGCEVKVPTPKGKQQRKHPCFRKSLKELLVERRSEFQKDQPEVDKGHKPGPVRKTKS